LIPPRFDGVNIPFFRMISLKLYKITDKRRDVLLAENTSSSALKYVFAGLNVVKSANCFHDSAFSHSFTFRFFIWNRFINHDLIITNNTVIGNTVRCYRQRDSELPVLRYGIFIINLLNRTVVITNIDFYSLFNRAISVFSILTRIMGDRECLFMV